MTPKINENASLYDVHFQAFSGFVRGRPSILVWKNAALRWSVFVGK